MSAIAFDSDLELPQPDTCETKMLTGIARELAAQAALQGTASATFHGYRMRAWRQRATNDEFGRVPVMVECVHQLHFIATERDRDIVHVASAEQHVMLAPGDLQ